MDPRFEDVLKPIDLKQSTNDKQDIVILGIANDEGIFGPSTQEF